MFGGWAAAHIRRSSDSSPDDRVLVLDTLKEILTLFTADAPALAVTEVPELRQRKLLARRLPRYTPTTITDVRALGGALLPRWTGADIVAEYAYKTTSH